MRLSPIVLVIPALFLVGACGAIIGDTSTTIVPDAPAAGGCGEACGDGTLCCGGVCVGVNESRCFACDRACGADVPVCSMASRQCSCTAASCGAKGQRCEEASGTCVVCAALAVLPVRTYAGIPGVGGDFVRSHARPVGTLTWRSTPTDGYAERGDVGGRPWCSGVLVSANLFLTPAHCLDSAVSRGAKLPRRSAGVPASPAEVASLMRVDLGDPAVAPPTPDDAALRGAHVDVVGLVEYRLGDLDYALLRVEGKPAERFGYARLSPFELDVARDFALVGSPDGKTVDVGVLKPRAFVGNEVIYQSLGAAEARAGSALFDATTGLLVAMHERSTCETADDVASALRVTKILSASPRLREIAAGGLRDFDGDGHPDILVHESRTGSLAIRYLTGVDGGNVKAERAIAGVTVEPPWLPATRADFDGDGSLDVLLQHPSTGALQVIFLGGHDGQTSLRRGALSRPIPPDWKIRGAADFDGDGRPDLAGYSAVTGELGIVYLGGADGTLVRATGVLGPLGGAPGDWELGGVGDMDRDGVPDFTMVYGTGATVFVVYARPAGKSSELIFDHMTRASWNAGDASPTGWHAFGLADLDANGTLDLLWFNASDGRVGPWFMEGLEGTSVARNLFIDPPIDVAGGARPVP